MTEEEAVTKMQEIMHHDIESAHMEADDILCSLLISLGYQRLIEVYRQIDKWYA